MKISLKLISVTASACLAAMTAAHAEYYLVYPATVVTGCCNTCASPCSPCATCRCDSCMSTCHTSAVYYEKRLYHDSWRDKENRRSHYTIDTFEPVYLIDSCRTTQYYGNKRGYVTINYSSSPRHPHYVSTANDPYDPDMATADDEIMTDSDMNNQY